MIVENEAKQPIKVSMNRALKAQLDAYAKKAKVSRNRVVEVALARLLESDVDWVEHNKK